MFREIMEMNPATLELLGHSTCGRKKKGHGTVKPSPILATAQYRI